MIYLAPFVLIAPLPLLLVIERIRASREGQ
ncbi:hypothetical protein ABIE67_007843 [Streptomyces sp. V4I8]